MDKPRPVEFVQRNYDYARAEGLKTAAEGTLSLIARTEWGRDKLRELVGTEHIQDQRLQTSVAGLELANPVGLGAGWDKLVRATPALEAIGFSFSEGGTVTLRPQRGNPKARMWTRRDSFGGVKALNNLGFNSIGAEGVRRNIEQNSEYTIPLGLNVGKNRDTPIGEAAAEHGQVIEILYDKAAYFVINVSSPNTPGLRDLQRSEYLREIIWAAKASLEGCGGQKPLFVKISPDLKLPALDEIVELALAEGLAGLVIANTSTNIGYKGTSGWYDYPGGISGAHPGYLEHTTKMVRYVAEEVDGQLDVIAAGGANSGGKVLAKIAAGARAVQVVTGMREHHIVLTSVRLNRSILDFMEVTGIASLDEIRGRTELIGNFSRGTFDYLVDCAKGDERRTAQLLEPWKEPGPDRWDLRKRPR